MVTASPVPEQRPFYFLISVLLLTMCVCRCMCVQACLTLCDPMDCSPPGSSVHGILPARILEWIAMPSSRESSPPRDQTCVSYHLLHWQVDSLALGPPGKPIIEYEREREVAQSCPALCDPMDCGLPGSSVHGIFQAIVLEWIAISFSKGSSQPRDRTRASYIVDRRFTI